jgi:hypothetical protein
LAVVYRRLGATHTRWSGGSPHYLDAYEITVTSAGWPARSLEYEEWRDYRFPGTSRTDDHPQSSFRLGIPWRGGPKRLPLNPIPAGFAINTLFYSALAAALWLSARRIRSAIRSRRGLCPHCAYARAGIPARAPCPECGKPEL